MIRTYLHGPYPRSDALVAATRDLDRGRTTADVVSEAHRQDLRDLVALQIEAELDLLSDGLLRWQDLFRPIVTACSGLEPGALVRWFNNDTFFRAPGVTGDVRLDADLPSLFGDLAELPEPLAATLPSPLLFSRVCTGRADREGLMLELAERVLRPLADRFVERGCRLIHLQEPWLAFHGLEGPAWGAFEESVRLVTSGLGAATVLHTPFGDASPHVPALERLAVDALGFDFTETDVAALMPVGEKGIVIGGLDGRRSLLESVEDVVALVRMVSDRLGPRDIYLSSTCELELLPEGLARQKVGVLGQAGRRLKDLVP